MVSQSYNVPSSGKVIIHQRFGSRWWSWLIWFCLLISLGFNYYLYRSWKEYLQPLAGLRPAHHSLTPKAPNKIAILRVEGVLLTVDDFLRQQIETIRKDESIKAVVLRVDSPGGSVAASDELYHLLTTLREEKQIPFVVSMGSIAASGGYYVSMAVGSNKDSIFAEPSTITGSIGVIIPHYTVTGLMTNLQIEDTSIASGPLKQMGSPTRPRTSSEQAVFESLVGEMFARFKLVIREGRPRFERDPAQLDALATGQVYTTSQALENGLVDRVGFLEDAIARAQELAQLLPGEAQAIEYQRPFDLVREVLPLAESREDVALRLLAESAHPKGYYLYGGLPGVLAANADSH